MIASNHEFATPVKMGVFVAIVFVVYSQTIYWVGLASAVPQLNLMYYPAYFGVLFFFLRKHKARLAGDYGRQLAEGAIVTLTPALLYMVYVAIFGYLTDYAFMEEMKAKFLAEAAAAGRSAAELQAMKIDMDESFTLDMLFLNFAGIALIASAIMPAFFRKRSSH